MFFPGQVGITLNSDWSEPKDPNNPEDVAASERVMQMKLGWYANPIFGDGDYPQVLKERLADVAKALGLPKSPLPEFTAEEKKLNKGVELTDLMFLSLLYFLYSF